MTVQLSYSEANATDDSNINGFLKDSPVSLQQPVERLLTPPQSLTIKVEMPITSITPSSPPPPPPITTCTPPPKCAYEKPGCLYAQAGVVYCPISPTPVPVTPTPTPTPKPATGTVNAQMKFEGYTNGPVEVSLYGILDLPIPIARRSNEFVDPIPQTKLTMLLGKGRTNPDGSAPISISSEYLNKPFNLFIESSSHLRKFQISDPKPMFIQPDCLRHLHHGN